MTGITTGGMGLEPPYARVVRNVLRESSLPDESRLALAAALLDRIGQNVEGVERDVDLDEVRDAIEAVVHGVARVQTVPPSELSVASANTLIDWLCEELHLPWPVCPA
jgi:hypothetical protein